MHRPWTLEVGLTTLYDTNILRYSSKYINRFIHGDDPGRFHIKTLDDVILRPSLRLEREFDLLPRLLTTVSGELIHRIYLNNSRKNWTNMKLVIKQAVFNRTAIQMAYSWTPDFYVRHHRDEDWVDRFGSTPETFQSFDFKKEDVGGMIQHTLRMGTRVSFSFSRARYFYNSHFTEYDSHNSVWAIEASHPVLRNFRVSAGYQFTSSKATGVDQQGEQRSSSDDSDGSFEEDSYSAGAVLKLDEPFGLASTLSVDGEYSRRAFTSEHFLELDPLHAGRVDNDYEIRVRYAVRFSAITVATSYEWRFRDASSKAAANEAYVSDEKDYRNYVVGLGVTYEIQF